VRLLAVLTCTGIKEEKQDIIRRIFRSRGNGIEFCKEVSYLVVFAKYRKGTYASFKKE
jgi:hypothetical protein